MGTLQVTTPTTSRGVSSNSGTLRLVLGTWQFSSSYPLGGEAVTFPVKNTPIAVFLTAVGGYTYQWTGTKIKAYASGGTEAASTTDLGALGPIPLYLIENVSVIG